MIAGRPLALRGMNVATKDERASVAAIGKASLPARPWLRIATR